MLSMKKLALALLIFCVSFGFAYAQDEEAIEPTPADQIKLKKRWELNVRCSPPKYMSYTNAMDKITQCWIGVYEVINPTDDEIYMGISTFAKTEKELYYPNLSDSLIETEFIKREENLGGYSYDILQEKIESLKKSGKYLNAYEMNWVTETVLDSDGNERHTTRKRTIKPKEKLTGLVFFKDVDEKFETLEVRFLGLYDVLRFKTEVNPYLVDFNYEMPDFQYEYEDRTVSVFFKRSGTGKFVQYSQLDFVRQEMIIQSFGYMDDPQTMKNLIDALESQDPMVRTFASGILSKVFPLSKEDGKAKYNPLESIVDDPENKEAILLWKEFWFRKKNLVRYDPVLKVFFIAEEKKEE